MRLRPGMFVQVKFAAPAGHDVLAVPRSAVLDTGMRKFVYVAKGNGEFEGRQVHAQQAGQDPVPTADGARAKSRQRPPRPTRNAAETFS
jgi:membrane fusion protein, copper/silver efflux system